MSKSTTKTIIASGPFFDAYEFIHYLEGVRLDENHPPVDLQVVFSGYYRVDVKIHYTGLDSDLFKEGFKIAEQFPTLRFKFGPISELNFPYPLTSRMRFGKSTIKLAATQSVSANDPMISMNEDEKFLYVLERLGISLESLQELDKLSSNSK